MKRTWALLLTALALVWALSACGSSGNDSGEAASGSPAPTSASEQLVVKATKWQFDQKEYTIDANTPVEIKLVNEEGAHGLQIKGTNVKLSNAKTSQIVSLAPGTYDMKCSIACGTGHLAMTAKLIVK